ncbi:hypothetical protein C8F01DRAFT_1087905 [Mycena amicta]|nr:hypothetical protein C8F01DRAFT_1087905 [Mycena amicta]
MDRTLKGELPSVAATVAHPTTAQYFRPTPTLLMCKHEIIIDRYTLCGLQSTVLRALIFVKRKHREWLNYTGKKVDCDVPTCLTSPKHIHPGPSSQQGDCGCPQYVEDIEKLRTVHESLCSSCRMMKSVAKISYIVPLLSRLRARLQPTKGSQTNRGLASIVELSSPQEQAVSQDPRVRPHMPSSSPGFSFKVPQQPSSAQVQVQAEASTSAAATSPAQKPRRVSLALPSSPRVVPAWKFRDDTTIPYARKGKVRRIDTTQDPDDDEDGEAEERAPIAPEKRQRRKWTAEETQMLVDGCQIHGVGNWKSILSDPNLSFDNRSPVDLKDRFRTYFPEAYRSHYPNARTHLPSSLPSSSLVNVASLTKPNRSTHPDGTPLFPTPPSAHPKRRPFTQEEDSALLAGFRKHGAAWATIVKEAPVFGTTGRRSMDLRDRFRNAWPEEYEKAGYKARPRAARRAGKDKEVPMVKEELEEETRGRARVGRSKTDEGLPRTTGTSVDAASAMGPVRRRRRAHTSQGFKSMSMPGSDDEGDDGPASDMAKSEFGAFSFGSAASDFTFKFANPQQQQKGEETGLVGGMEHLVVDRAPDGDLDEPMPDVDVSSAVPSPPQQETSQILPTTPPQLSTPSPSKLQHAHFLHRRQEELASLGLSLGSSSAGPTIGRSAWGPQDWFSANPRLDSSSGFTSTVALNSPPLAHSSIHSPPLSNSASFPLETSFELTHGVMERYDLEQPAMYGLQHQHNNPSARLDVHHHHHHSASASASGAGPPPQPHAAFSSPALSFHSSFELDSFDAPHSEAGHSFSSEYGVSNDMDLLEDAESEPGGAAWGGGFRGFTHHSNTAGDLIFGARTHQPVWNGFAEWGAGRGAAARGRGLTGIAEVRGGKNEEGEEAGASRTGEKVFSLDDLVDIPPEADNQADAGDDLAGGDEPPGTPLLRPTTVQTVHVHHHHHHHHHHYGPPPSRARSVPPEEAVLQQAQILMSAPTTPSLAAAPMPMSPRTTFALDPTTLFGLGVGQQQRLSATSAATPNAASSTSASAVTHGHGEAIYLPFLDLHYYGAGAMEGAIPTETWRGGEALDLARSNSATASFSSASASTPFAMGHGMWPGLGMAMPPSRQLPPPHPVSAGRPLMRSMSGGIGTSKSKSGVAAALAARGLQTQGTTPSALTRASSSSGHQRGQSAIVVRPQDLVLSSSTSGSGSEPAPKGKRKRASWDGAAW